ncbi:hypothetical protein F5Y14DRAFT_147833 [Nemania sp. NC0429]|nr:hypothetical protein F5Y14DRAFT_147833 [Nemania sp. NC0429]
MGSGEVQSASGLVLALLEQLCDEQAPLLSLRRRDGVGKRQDGSPERNSNRSDNTFHQHGKLDSSSRGAETELYHRVEGYRNQLYDIPEPGSQVVDANVGETQVAENSLGSAPEESSLSLSVLLNELRNPRNLGANSTSQPFIIIDGWDGDNMDSATEFRQVIETLCSIPCRILLSSRSRPNGPVTPTGRDITEIGITRMGQAADAELCVSKMLRDREPPLSNNEIESTTRSILEASVNEFNLAKILTLAVLRSDPTTVVQRLNKAPDQMPLFTILEFLNLGYVSQIIICLLLAIDRPLTLKALEASLPILVKHTSTSGHNLDESTAADAIRSCEPLVTVDPSNQLVRLNPEIKNHRPLMYEYWTDTASQLCLGVVRTAIEFFTGGQSLDGLVRAKSDIGRLFQENPFLEHLTMWPTYIHRLACIGTDKLDEARQLADTLFDRPECLLYAKQCYFYLNEESICFTMTSDSFNTWMRSMGRLQLASCWGLTHLVERILADLSEPVTEHDTRSSTALHEAAKGGFLDIAKLLLGRNAPTDAPDSDGKIPLDYAFEHRHRDVRDMLFESQVISSSYAQTKLIRDEIVFSYCQERSGMADARQQFRARELTMLRGISSDDKNQGRIAIFLLERGTDPNCVNENGVPAMHLAIEHRQNDMLAALLEKDAEASTRVTKGRLQESALHVAARSGAVKAVELLLKANADVNCLNSKQRTPLFDALEGGDKQEIEKIVKLLIYRGADVDRADGEGRRVLHVAAEKGLILPLRMFSFWAKDKNPIDKNGERPLKYAERKGHEEAIQFLSGLA